MFLALSFGGCAYLSGRHQTLLVTSDPSGAQVYDRGKLIGTTPSYMPVRRRKDAELEFRYPDKTVKTVPLKSKYRWWDSFGGNALFLVYAPIGWGVDYWTGAAYDFDDPPFTKAPLPSKPRLAIAPPTGEFAEMADGFGREIESLLNKEGKYQVISYDKTHAHFEFFETQKFLPAEPAEKREFLTLIGADAVLFTSTSAAKDSGKIDARSTLINVYTGEKAGEREFQLLEDADVLATKKRFGDLFHFIPNTIFVNFSNYSANLEVAGQEIKGKGVPDGTLFEAVSRYVGAIGISRLTRPRRSTMGFNWEFVPTGNLSVKRMRFQLSTPPQDQDFDRKFINAGYGIEVGYFWTYGYPYFDIFPVLQWTELKYDVNGAERKVSNTAITAVIEAGYLYYFNRHIVMKLFTRSIQEDPELWRQALREVLGPNTQVESVNSQLSGLALGYHF